MIVLDLMGHKVAVWSGPNINDSWGNTGWVDNGSAVAFIIGVTAFGEWGPFRVLPGRANGIAGFGP
jgi:hypothetical protein